MAKTTRKRVTKTRAKRGRGAAAGTRKARAKKVAGARAKGRATAPVGEATRSPAKPATSMAGKSAARTVDEFLAGLPPDRRATVARVRDVVRHHLPAGYEEAMNWGMICYQVPLTRYPSTYNNQPLCYAALTAQKNYYSLYLMGGYADDQGTTLRGEFEKAGKKLDMGRSCVRFRTLDDLPLDVIGAFIASIPPEKYIAHYEASRRRK